MSLRRFHRMADHDAIARVRAGIKHKPEPLKRKKARRPEWTYRAYWRNVHRNTWRAA